MLNHSYHAKVEKGVPNAGTTPTCPVSPVVLDEIESILKRCRSGGLRHDQASWHCGTVHCLAGWHTVFKYPDEFAAQVKHRSANENWCISLPGRETKTDGDIAKEDWGLTDTEAAVLFDGCSGYSTQFALISLLRKGHRLHIQEEFPQSPSDGSEIRNWLSESRRLNSVSEDTARQLEMFANCLDQYWAESVGSIDPQSAPL
jgi:hypothetical protein